MIKSLYSLKDTINRLKNRKIFIASSDDTDITQLIKDIRTDYSKEQMSQKSNFIFILVLTAISEDLIYVDWLHQIFRNEWKLIEERRNAWFKEALNLWYLVLSFLELLSIGLSFRSFAQNSLPFRDDCDLILSQLYSMRFLFLSRKFVLDFIVANLIPLLFCWTTLVSVVVVTVLWILFLMLISKFHHLLSDEFVRASSRITFAIILNISFLISIIDSFCECIFCAETLMIDPTESDDSLSTCLMNNFEEYLSLI